MINNNYRLIDSGNFQKLELIGKYKIIRPAPQAIWKPFYSSTEWENPDAFFIRDSKGTGQWQIKNKKLPESWQIDFEGLQIKIKLTGFGHIGLFPEQKENIIWIQDQIKTLDFKPSILNLFAYTGISSLACLKAGANLTHVDASKPVVEWAKINTDLSSLDKTNGKWIVEDVSKFVAREIKRGNYYDGIILDPPSFGRGPKNEIWKLEEDLYTLLLTLKKLFSKRLQFVILSGHSNGITPITLQNCIKCICPNGTIFSKEMTVYEENSKKTLPSGATCNWSRSL